jgi:hypothetical protein
MPQRPEFKMPERPAMPEMTKPEMPQQPEFKMPERPAMPEMTRPAMPQKPEFAAMAPQAPAQPDFVERRAAFEAESAERQAAVQAKLDEMKQSLEERRAAAAESKQL